jgi:hypothetical protein
MGKTPHCATLRSPAAKLRNAGKTRAKGCLRLGAPISVARLAGVPIKCASGTSEHRRKRKTPKGISDAESAFEVGRANRLFRFCRLSRVGGGFFNVAFGIHVGVHGLPSANAHQHAVGVLDGIHMAIMVLDHLDRGAHLFGQNIDVHALAKPEGGVGVAEAIGRTGDAVRPHPQVSFHEQRLNGVAVEIFCRLSVDDREHGIIGRGGLGQIAHAVEIFTDALGSHELARLSFALNEHHDDLAPVAILGERDVAPAQILRLGRTHPRVAHDEHEIVAYGAIPGALGRCRRSDPFAPDTVQLAIFLYREFVAPHRFEFWPAFKTVAGRHKPLGDGKVHDCVERAHFKLDRRIADMLAEPAFAIFPPPSRVARPTVLTDQVDLGAADIIFERLLEGISEILHAVMGNFTRIGAPLLRLEIVCRHLPKRTIEHGNIVLHAKPDVGVLIERAVAGGLPVRRMKRNRLVAILFGELDAAIEIAVFDIAAPENDQAGL